MSGVGSFYLVDVWVVGSDQVGAQCVCTVRILLVAVWSVRLLLFEIVMA